MNDTTKTVLKTLWHIAKVLLAGYGVYILVCQLVILMSVGMPAGGNTVWIITNLGDAALDIGKGFALIVIASLLP